MNNRKIDRAKIVEDLVSKQAECPESDFYKSALSAVLSCSTEDGDGGEPTCSSFVTDYITINNIKLTPAGLYKGLDLIKNPKVLIHKMHQSFKEMKRDNFLKTTLTREEIALEIESIMEENWEKSRDALRVTLAPLPDTDTFNAILSSVARALVGKEATELQIRTAMAFLAHFAWSTMTKLHKGPKAVLRGGNEAVLMLVSPKQKTGKSTTVRHMVKPFDDAGFIWKARLDRLDDSFSFSNLAYNYIALFDDMCTASSINLGKFKQVITDDEVSFRMIYTSTEIKLPKMATLIGTSNKSPRELMHDTTGLRRFHVIDVANENVYSGEGINLDVITNTDWSMYYRLCPLTETSPLFTYITPDELATYEEALRPKHIVELWLEDKGMMPTCGGTHVYLSDLYQDFRSWAYGSGYSPQFVPTSKSFSMKLVELRFTKGRNSNGVFFFVA